MARKSKKTELPQRLEEALGELEGVVGKLESSDVALEDSIELFERGSQLAQVCYGKLQEAEKKVELLIKKAPKIASREDFETKEFGAE